jgi:hypothetical protein
MPPTPVLTASEGRGSRYLDSFQEQRIREGDIYCVSLTFMAIDHILALLISERDKLTAAIEALQEQAPGPDRKAVAPSVEQDSKPKRKLSAAGRRAIIAGTKKRWAAIKAAKAPAPAPAPAKKGTLTEAGRTALSIAMKKRWAKKKATAKRKAA